MQIDDDLTERLGASMAALNARIARLAMALDVAMSDRSQVAALMVTPQMQTVVIERRGRSSILGITADRRREHKREELRGLLVLRYHMETTSLNNNGYIVTRQMLILAEAHLVRRGFKPGADGLSVDEFFNVT